MIVEDNVRDFQRKLYLKAKREKCYKFYSLYDKIYRWDVLLKAFDHVRANKGAAGVDGVSVSEFDEKMEDKLLEIQEELKERRYKPQSVKRVYIPKADGSKRPLGIPTLKDRVVQTACKIVIEPIFEADFDKHSYGFRPKRNAHQAIEVIRKLIQKGYYEILDADISKYFDTIPHRRLIEKIKRRIADGNVIRLIKSWLISSVSEQNENGKWIITGGKSNKYGTPQGGVISPLLANIYLHELDETFYKDDELGGKVKHVLIRYADDFIILGKGLDAGVKGWLKQKLEKMELRLNEVKTKIVDVRKESFTFLGFRFSYQRSLYYSNSCYLVIEPCLKSVKHLYSTIREAIMKYRWLGLDELILLVNRILKGWKSYFGNVGYPRRIFRKVNYYLQMRFYFWSRRLSQRRSKLFKPGVYAVLKKRGLYFL